MYDRSGRNKENPHNSGFRESARTPNFSGGVKNQPQSNIQTIRSYGNDFKEETT